MAAWLALAVGFSPVLVDLARNLLAFPHDHCTLVAPVLLALVLRAGVPRQGPRPGLGAGLIACGASLQLAGIAIDGWSLSRLGLPVAALGVAAWLGCPPLAATALLFWLVPIPDSILVALSPSGESLLSRLGVALARPLAAELEAVGSLVRAGDAYLPLEARDWGHAPIWALSATGWFASVRLGRSVATGMLWAALGGAAGIAAHLLFGVLGIAWFALGDPAGLAFVWIRELSWLLPAAAATLAIERRARSAKLDAKSSATSHVR
jgi:hypothetical protein